jgi:intracellular septation protein
MATTRRHRIIRAVVDYGGLALFALGYLATRDLIAATWWLVGGSAASLAIGFVMERRIAPMPLLAGGAALLFGALTLIFNDEAFVKAKPTVMNYLFATLILGGLAMRKNLLQALLGESLRLPDGVWRTLALRYSVFFIGLGTLNLFVWLRMSDGAWVLFRFPIMQVLAIGFSLTQLPLMMKHMREPEAPPPPVD